MVADGFGTAVFVGVFVGTEVSVLVGEGTGVSVLTGIVVTSIVGSEELVLAIAVWI